MSSAAASESYAWLNRARREYAGVTELYEGDQRSGAVIQVDLSMWEREPAYVQHIVQLLLEQEKDAIYRTVVASSAEWTAIRSRILEDPFNPFSITGCMLKVQVDGYAADRRVYVPVVTQAMPKNVFHCSYCGGYTHNDKRGNCAACGGPRTENPDQWGWLHD